MVDRMTPEFYQKMQRYIVNSSVDITVLRLRPEGTVQAAQNYLCAFDLTQLATPNSFRDVLDATTADLSDAFPFPSWGHARKCLNIFLRRVVYDHYLRQRYGLGAIEQALEVPLDKNVAVGITSAAKRYGLSPPPSGIP